MTLKTICQMKHISIDDNIYVMQTLHYSIIINAPREKVWNAMLEDKTYREWTTAFHPGSFFRGDWSKGSKMLFIGPNPDTGTEDGMVSRIAENIPYEYLSIEHLGVLRDGVEDTTGEEAKKWAPAFENYIFNEKDGMTELLIELDSLDEYADMFNSMWPEGLKVLKEISERS